MPVSYSLYVIGLSCIGGIAGIAVGLTVYVLSKRFRLIKAIPAAVITFFLVAILLPMLVAFLNDVGRGAQRKFEASALTGVWEANYEEVGHHFASGTEVLTLKADGTYQQVYKDGKGYVYTSPLYQWWLEKGRIIHLENGRFYLFGIDWAESLEEGEAYITLNEITMDGTEIILYVLPDPNAPGGVILEHVPVGDGDAPEYVQFYRVSTAVPESTDGP